MCFCITIDLIFYLIVARSSNKNKLVMHFRRISVPSIRKIELCLVTKVDEKSRRLIIILLKNCDKEKYYLYFEK